MFTDLKRIELEIYNERIAGNSLNTSTLKKIFPNNAQIQEEITREI